MFREIEQNLPISLSEPLLIDGNALQFLEDLCRKLANEISLCGFCARIGLQYSPDQVDNQEKILSFSDNTFDTRSALLRIQTDIGPYKLFLSPDMALKIFALCYPLLSYVFSAEERENKFKNLTCFCREFGDVIDTTGKYSHFLSDERIGCQIDCAPKPVQVRYLAEKAIKLNQGFKKKESQRQKEKSSKSQPDQKPISENKDIKELNLSPEDFQEHLWKWLEAKGSKVIKEDLTTRPGYNSENRPEGHSTHNLFVKGKKSSSIYLITMLQATKANLKSLAKELKEKELRFVDIKSKKYDDLLCQKEGCLTLLSLFGNKIGRVKSVLSNQLNNLDENTLLRFCAGCKDPVDHSQHNMVDISWKYVKQLLLESNTSTSIVINF